MPISVTCVCGKRYQVKEAFAGRTARCPNCKAKLVVPAAESSELYEMAPMPPPAPPVAESPPSPPVRPVERRRRSAGLTWGSALKGKLIATGACIVLLVAVVWGLVYAVGLIWHPQPFEITGVVFREGWREAVGREKGGLVFYFDIETHGGEVLGKYECLLLCALSSPESEEEVFTQLIRMHEDRPDEEWKESLFLLSYLPETEDDVYLGISGTGGLVYQSTLPGVFGGSRPWVKRDVVAYIVRKLTPADINGRAVILPGVALTSFRPGIMMAQIWMCDDEGNWAPASDVFVEKMREVILE